MHLPPMGRPMVAVVAAAAAAADDDVAARRSSEAYQRTSTRRSPGRATRGGNPAGVNQKCHTPAHVEIMGQRRQTIL